jgi:localization factor PodJL
MKPGMPWSVKGIDPETREAAKDAARRSGMTLGEWLNTMILDQSDEDGNPLPPAPLPEESSPRPSELAAKRADMSVRLEEIASQLAQIARRDNDTKPTSAQSYMPPPQPPRRSDDGDDIRKILGRIDSNEHQTVEAFTAVNERLANLGRQIAQSMKDGQAPRPMEPQAIKSLEQAVRNIVEHIEISEKRSRDTLKNMQERLSEVAQREPATNEDAIHASLIADLEGKLGELSRRVERSEARPSAPPDMLRKELTELAERIETVRAAAEQLATRAQTQAVQTSQRELQEIERRILSVLKEAQSAFSSQGASNADFQKLRAEVSALNQRIDATKATAASERDVHALRVAMEQLQTRVAQGPDPRPFAEMDKKFADLSRRVEQAQAAPRIIPEIGQLERRMAEMDVKLKDAFKAQPDPRVHAAMERKLTEVADRMAKAEQQLGHVETIERAVNQLFESVEHTRSWARDAAEDAANRMGARLMSEMPRQAAGPNHSAELRMLEDGLRAVRESAVHADHRNQETLEAVHETLEQIVGKLAELETAAVGHQIAQATFAGNEPTSDAAQWSPTPQWSPAPQPEAYAEPEPEPEAPYEEPQIFGQSPEPEYKAEAQQDSWQHAEPAAEAPEVDYLALARKASLAAAHGQILAGAVAGGAAAEKSGGLFSGLSFKRKRDTSAWSSAMEARQMPEIRPAMAVQSGGKRRTLLLAGLVLLMVAGAFTFNKFSSAPSKPVSAIEPADTQAVAEAQTPAASIDELTTSALSEGHPDSTLQSIVATPGSLSNVPERPPTEIGTQALRGAAEVGDASAQFIVATRFLDGNGVAADLAQAAHWYQKSANAGLAPAQYRLATLFERGRGVPKDLATAMVWYTRAAEQGNVKSMHNVAVLAAGTELGAPNYPLAQKWFLAASRHGLKDSQFNLAVLYERGLGTDKNPAEAYFWYSIAASHKDQDAANRAILLAKAMPKKDVAEVNKRVEAWVPDTAPDAANTVSIQDPAWQDGRAAMPAPKAEDRLSTVSYLDRLSRPAPVYQPPPRDPLLSGSAGHESVGQTQQLLQQLGYNVGLVDGQMNAQTSNAIRLFQFQTRQRVTGRASQELIDQLTAQLG